MTGSSTFLYAAGFSAARGPLTSIRRVAGSAAAGSGTVTVKGAASETAPVRPGDALPIRIGESSSFTNTGTEPLELFVKGVAKDMAAKTQLIAPGR